MLKNKAGVTFINLVVMIVVMIILISITGYSSLQNVKNGYIARKEKEFSNVVEYVSVLRAKLLNDEFEVKENVLTPQELVMIADFLSDNYLNAMIDVNTSELLEDNYKYVYVTPTNLSDKQYSDGDIVVKDTKYSYIINFYTGTVIALYEDSDYKIAGRVKDLSTILNELGY